jgi:hypothetical protein
LQIKSDIDIDLADRSKLLSIIKHIPAAMLNVDPIRKHATGVHITEIPYDPIHDMASIDYKEAERRGYFKLDLLNVHVYDQVKSEEHLVSLMREPNWAKLYDPIFVEKLIHLSNHFYAIKRMPEPINSIPRLAMFLAAIRPSKKHLIGKKFKEVSETVWDKDPSGYVFKRSHSLAYAQLVVIHMNLLEEQGL